MSPEFLTSAGGLLFSILIFVFLGRIICIGANTNRAVMSTGLYYFLTGFSVWYLTFLTALLFDKYMISSVWWGFVMASIALFVILLKRRDNEKLGEHFFTQIAMSALFLTPAFAAILGDTPQLAEEFNGALRQAQYIIYKGYIPPLNEAEAVGLNLFNEAPSLLAAVLPSQLITQQFSPSAFALFNIVLLLFVAESLTRTSDIRVKWSNLPLVAASSLTGMTLLNPFFDLQSITTASKDMLYATVLYAAIAPFVREKEIPTGIKALPAGLLLALLAGMDALGIIAALLVFVFYLCRMLLDKQEWDLSTAFSIVALAVLPVFSWLLWQNETYDAALAGVFDHVKQYGLIGENTVRGLGLNWLHALVLLAILAVSIIQLFDQNVRQNIQKHMWLFAPTFVVFGYIISGSIIGADIHIEHLQFVILIPMWRWAMWWYEDSALKESAYKYPWALGFGLALFLMVTQSIFKQDLTERYDDAMLHTFNTGRLLATEYVIDNEHVAVLDVPRRALLTHNLLQYAMADKANHVMPAASLLYDAANDKNLFYKKLSKQGISYLWVHAPYNAYAELFNEKLDARSSYIFSLQNGEFIMERKLRHPSYNANALDQACKTHACVFGDWIQR